MFLAVASASRNAAIMPHLSPVPAQTAILYSTSKLESIIYTQWCPDIVSPASISRTMGQCREWGIKQCYHLQGELNLTKLIYLASEPNLLMESLNEKVIQPKVA